MTELAKSVDMWFTRSTPRISVVPYEDTGDRSGSVWLMVSDGETSNSMQYIMTRTELSDLRGSLFEGTHHSSLSFDGVSIWFNKEDMSELLFALEMI